MISLLIRLPRLCAGRILCFSVVIIGIAVSNASAVNPSSQPSAAVHFLSADEARTAIVDDRSDPYFELLAASDMRAKAGRPLAGDTVAEQRESYKRLYQTTVRDFSDADKEMVQWYVARYQPVTQKYPLYAQTPWNLIKTTGELEWGFCLTRGNNIILTMPVIRQLQRSREQDDVVPAVLQGHVLLHEKVHVVQRSHPGLFDTLYTQVWGLRRAKQIESCDWLRTRQVVNPDGTDCGWVFPIRENGSTRWIWPLMAYVERDPAVAFSIRDIGIIGVDVRQDGEVFRVKTTDRGRPIFRNLAEERAYIEMLGSADNAYHPNEAAAEAFAAIVMFDNFTPQQTLRDPEVQRELKALEPARKWFAEHLASTEKK